MLTNIYDIICRTLLVDRLWRDFDLIDWANRLQHHGICRSIFSDQ